MFTDCVWEQDAYAHIVGLGTACVCVRQIIFGSFLSVLVH